MRLRTVVHHVEIEGNVSAIYRSWSDLELFPRFIDCLCEVRHLGERRFSWMATLNGETSCGECLITLQIPDQRIAWRVIGEEGTSGALSLEPLADCEPEKTRLTLRLTYSESSQWAVLSEAAIRKHVAGSLRRFKRLFEAGHAAPDFIIHNS